MSKNPPFAQAFAIYWCAAEKGNIASLGPAYADVSLSVEMQDERLVSSITNLPQLAKAMNLGVNELRNKLFDMGAVELITSDMFGAGLTDDKRSILFSDPSKVMRVVFEKESGEPLLFRGMNLDAYLDLKGNPLKGTDQSSRNETYRNAIGFALVSTIPSRIAQPILHQLLLRTTAVLILAAQRVRGVQR